MVKVGSPEFLATMHDYVEQVRLEREFWNRQKRSAQAAELASVAGAFRECISRAKHMPLALPLPRRYRLRKYARLIHRLAIGAAEHEEIEAQHERWAIIRTRQHLGELADLMWRIEMREEELANARDWALERWVSDHEYIEAMFEQYSRGGVRLA
jgi:hypothetical protein